MRAAVVEAVGAVEVAAAAAEARPQPRPAAEEVPVRDGEVVDRRRLASAAAAVNRSRPGHDRVEATDLAPALALAGASGSGGVAMGVEPANSVAVMVVDRGSVEATERAGRMPDRAFAIAVASVARESVTGQVDASVMVADVTIVATCAGTDANIRGVRESRSGSTMATTMAIAVG